MMAVFSRRLRRRQLFGLFSQHPVRPIHIETKGEPLKFESLVTCLPGLEKILSAELSDLGIAHQSISHGARFLQPTSQVLFKSYLHLGTASNILIRCGEPFSARGMAELRRKTSKLPWEQFLGSTQVRLTAKVSTSKSKLLHSAAIEGRVVAGVYEALGYTIPNDRETLEYPPTVSALDPVVRLGVHIARDQVTIWLYASDTPLHRRGYRLETCKAPLREDLAYAMLYGGGWRPFDNRKHGDTVLLDPFCGSGTIAIEGATMVAGLAPGRLRSPPWVGMALENMDLHQELLSHALPLEPAETLVFASDRDTGAISATTANAKRAEVLDYIDIQQHAVTTHPIWSKKPDKNLLVVTNPPFGKRISKSSKNARGVAPLLPLYQSLRNLTMIRRNTSILLLCQGKGLINRAGWKFRNVFQSTHGGLSVTAVSSNSVEE